MTSEKHSTSSPTSVDAARARADGLVAQMTLEEKVGLLHAPMTTTPGEPPGAIGSAACTAGIERLGIPTFQESDAGLGIANPGGRPDNVATALPCGLMTAASFDSELARRGGAVVGAESRVKGFAIQLAGGANLIREPRGGRNFEYLSEGPLLTGVLAGAAIAGVQSQKVASTVKHFAVNAQETGRVMVSSEIGEQALRESDLLAFQIAIERGRPGAVMTAYNAVNGEYASESRFLIARVLKGDWGYAGVAISDWGGMHSTEDAALAGHDRQSGYGLDAEAYFGDALAEAVRAGRVPQERIDDMVARLLRALIVAGALDDDRAPAPISAATYEAHCDEAQAVAEQGIVLMRNDGTLPLGDDVTRIAMVGGHADTGVLSGGGSSQVLPPGSTREEGISIPQLGELPRVYHPSVPLHAMRAARPDAEVSFDDGTDPARAAAAAGRADVAVIFVEQWMTEGQDAPSLSLPGDQDALVSAVAAANPRTVVVLETGGPVLMPWLDEVAAVVESWYGGSRGAEALTRVLVGEVNPSGRLPVTFPRGIEQLPRPQQRDPATTTSNPGQPRKGSFSEDYHIEGSDVGYRWYHREGLTPLFAFGHGLSYTTFSYTDLAVDQDDDGAVRVLVTVANTGKRNGIDTPQVYVTPPPQKGAGAPRLAGWGRVALDAGQAQRTTIVLDEPRILGRYDTELPGWSLASGSYVVALSADAQTPVLSRRVELGPRHLDP